MNSLCEFDWHNETLNKDMWKSCVSGIGKIEMHIMFCQSRHVHAKAEGAENDEPLYSAHDYN